MTLRITKTQKIKVYKNFVLNHLVRFPTVWCIANKRSINHTNMNPIPWTKVGVSHWPRCSLLPASNLYKKEYINKLTMSTTQNYITSIGTFSTIGIIVSGRNFTSRPEASMWGIQHLNHGNIFFTSMGAFSTIGIIVSGRNYTSRPEASMWGIQHLNHGNIFFYFNGSILDHWYNRLWEELYFSTWGIRVRNLTSQSWEYIFFTSMGAFSTIIIFGRNNTS